MKMTDPFTIHQLLIFACRSGDIPLVQERITLGGDVNYYDPGNGSSLFEAVRKDNPELVAFLLDAGADLKIQDNKGRGVVEAAIYHNSRNALRLLLDRGAHIVNKGKPNYHKILESFRATGRFSDKEIT
ncbi:MAG: ankyrin repeat domain-containing protein [Luteolibacter sp.]